MVSSIHKYLTRLLFFLKIQILNFNSTDIGFLKLDFLIDENYKKFIILEILKLSVARLFLHQRRLGRSQLGLKFDFFLKNK